MGEILRTFIYAMDTNPMEDLSDGAGPGSVGLTVVCIGIVAWVIWMSTRS
jgi:hypothetical protein